VTPPNLLKAPATFAEFSKVFFRMHTLVYVKAAAGGSDNEVVFLAQLLEHVVEVTMPARGRRRSRPGFVNDKPRVRFFSRAEVEGQYHYDPNTYDKVNVSAIYGEVRSFSTVELNSDGLLVAFKVEEEELNHMERVVNEADGDDDDIDVRERDDGPDSEALAQHEERERQSRAITEDSERLILPVQVNPNNGAARYSLRVRAPTHDYYILEQRVSEYYQNGDPE
jgi:hypothetical protein